MSILFTGDLAIAYSQFYIVSEDDLQPDPVDAFRGQENGLAGGAAQHSIFFLTGTTMGTVSLEIELCDSRPDCDLDVWEDVVEISFLPRLPVVLRSWEGYSISLELPMELLRVRYCARGMDAAHRVGGTPQGVPGEAYAVRMWRDQKFGLDAIVGQRSQHADYLNSVPATYNS